MKAGKKLKSFLLAACLVFAGTLLLTDSVYAQRLSSAAQAKQKALQQVKGATVTDVELDRDNGVQVYDVALVKGVRKYDIQYRVSDGKMLAYGWEKIGVGSSSGKQLIGKEKCRQLALNKVKNSTILSITHKYDDGYDYYKVKLAAGNKDYTLEYHARTGALLAYDWELTETANAPSGYIGLEKAKSVARAKVPGATVIKAEFDMDDGTPVYEVEMIKGRYEYDLKIHASTGAILEYDRDLAD